MRLEHVVEASLDQLAVAVEELAVHVDGLIERVAPRLVLAQTGVILAAVIGAAIAIVRMLG